MPLHKRLPLDQRHAPHAFEYADAAARTGAVGLTADDVRKTALQLDNNTTWILTNHIGPEWQHVGDNIPMALESCLVSPRVITDADNGKTLIASAHVAGGFQFVLPATAEIGTRVTLSTLANTGFSARIIADATGAIVGGGSLASPGVSELKATQEGASITLAYIGGAGRQWVILDGIGQWQVQASGVPTGDVYAFTPAIPGGTLGGIVTLDADGQIADSTVTLDTVAARPWFREYLDETERLADTTLVASDVGKCALQLDTMTLWRFVAEGPPPTWARVAGDHGTQDGLEDDDHPQYSLRNYAVETVALAPRDIVMSDAGKVLTWVGTGPCTFTLPSASLLPAGWHVRILNRGSSPPASVVTINTTGGDTFLLGDSTTGTSLVSGTDGDSGASIDLSSDGVSAWHTSSGNGSWSDGVITKHFDAHIPGATAGNLVSINPNGDMQDSGKSALAIVIGPASATNQSIPIFDGVSGKFIKGTQTYVDILDSYSGIGTATFGAPRIKVGTNDPSNDDSALLVCRGIVGESLFSHAVRDESTFVSTITGAYASFDSIPVMSGSTPYNHIAAFQCRHSFIGTGGLADSIGFSYYINNTGAISAASAIRVYDYSGGGTIGDFYALYVGAITKPTRHWVLYSPGTSMSYHAGRFGIGTSTPPSLLSVHGNTAAPTVFMDANNGQVNISSPSGANTVTKITFSTPNYAGTGGNAGIGVKWTGAGTYMYLGTSNTFAGINNTAIEIEPSGLVKLQSIPFTDTENTSLEGFTATSVLGALNELKTQINMAEGGIGMTVYSNIAGDFSVAFKDADEIEVFGLPFNISAIQIKRIIRKANGASASVIRTRGSDLVCTWTPDAAIEGKGVISTSSFGTLVGTDEYIIEIDGQPKGYHAATDSAKAMVTNTLHYCNDGVIANLAEDNVEIIKPLLSDGYNAFSLSAVLGAAGDGVIVLASNDPSGSSDYYDVTALALGVPQVSVSGAYQTAEPLMFQFIKLVINGTTSAKVYLTRFRK